MFWRQTHGKDEVSEMLMFSGLETQSDTESVCILPSMNEKRNSEESESTRLEGLYRKAADPVLRTHLFMVWRMSRWGIR